MKSARAKNLWKRKPDTFSPRVSGPSLSPRAPKALAISSAYELGDKIRFEESVDEFGRVAAQSAKQTIMAVSYTHLLSNGLFMWCYFIDYHSN